MKKTLSFVLSFVLGNYLYAQDDEKLPSQFDYLGAQTEVSAKQVSVKNNLSTGRVSLAFNLLSKKIHGLDISVGVNYLGGGMKVLDQPTSVGNGWGLSVGGAIVRHRRGVPDDYKNTNETHIMSTKLNGILYSETLKQSSDGEFRVSIEDPSYRYDLGISDSQHDIFSFTLPDQSGQFYVGKDKSIQVVGKNDVRIIPQFGDLPNIYSKIVSFQVVDNRGIKYYFEEFETTTQQGSAGGGWAEVCYFNKNYISAWYLTKIEFPSSNSTILFYYSSIDSNTPTFARLQFERLVESSDQIGLGRIGYSSIFNNTITKKTLIREIVFPDSSKVLFDYFGYPLKSNMLKRISMRDPAGQDILKYDLNYQWWDQGSSKLHYSVFDETDLPYNLTNLDNWYLEGVNKISRNGEREPFCAFTYYMTSSINESGVRQKKGVDYWGFYNGAENNENLIPHELKMMNPSQSSWTTKPAANRNANLSYAQIGVLKDVYFAAGGRESIEYELNDRLSNGVKETVGGLRVKSITTYESASNITMYKQYKYVKADGKSSGFLGDKGEYKFVENIYHDNGGWPTNPSLKKTKTTYVSHAINDVSSANGSHIAYTRVEEYITEFGSTNHRKTVYEFSGLDSVKNSLWFPQDYYPYRPVDRPNWAVGLPVAETVYDMANNVVKRTIRKFQIKQSTLNNENFRSLYVSKSGEVDVQNGGNGVLRFIYKHRNYYPVLGYSLLNETLETEFREGKSLTTKHSNTYDPTYGLLKTSELSDSEQQVLIRHYYPFEYTLAASSVFSQMTSKNMINTPILTEQWRRLKGDSYKLAGAALNVYRLESGRILPDKRYFADVSGSISMNAGGLFSPNVLIPTAYSFKVADLFIAYANSGELLEIGNAAGNKKSFIHNRQGLPIFIADNAPYNRIRYYGFETFEKPLPSGSTNGQVKSGQTFMGNYCFTGTISFGSLPTGDYIVECFAKGSSNIAVNSVQKQIGTGWNNIQWKVTNTTSISLATNGNLVDEIRIYPTGSIAEVSNFDLLGNAIGQIAANGSGYFSKYDGFNRLQYVYSDAQSLIKAIDYNTKPSYLSTEKSYEYTNYGCPAGYVPSGPVTYTIPAGVYSSLISQAAADEKATLAARFNGRQYANEYDNCVKGYWNTELLKSFTRNNCSAGTIGEEVTYRVPAAKYVSTISQADANNKALQDANQNGQTYANQNGKCFTPISARFSNDTNEIFEVIVMGPDGEEIHDLPLYESQIPVLTDNNYSFHFRPKGGEDPTALYEFLYNSGVQSKSGPSATFSITAPSSVHFSITRIN